MDALTEQLTFDYAEIGDEPTAKSLQQYARYIRGQERTLVQCVINIGATLIDAKKIVPHGMFMRWVAVEFPLWSYDSAVKYMRICESCKVTPRIAELGTSVLHDLLAPSAPPAALEEAMEIKATGEKVTVAKAREIVKKHKPAKAETIEVDPPESYGDEEDEMEPEYEAPELPKAETVFTRLREIFDEMTPLQRVTAGGMWRNWSE